MKNLLVSLGVGAGLFAATAFGLLAAQGRLNYEGTQGIPLLSALFSKPAAPDHKGEKGDKGDKGDKSDKGERDEPGEKDGKVDPDAARADDESRLAPAAKPLPFRKGASILNPPKTEGAGGHGDKGAKHEEPTAAHEPESANDSTIESSGERGPAKKDEKSGERDPAEEKGGDKSNPREKPSERDQRLDELLGEGRFRRGRLFKFPTLEGGISSEELNSILRRAQKKQEELDGREKSLEQRKQELDARETDVRDRQKDVGDRLAEVMRKRQELERDLDEFHRTVLLIKLDEEKGLKEFANTIAKFEPKSAADMLLKWWRDPEGQVRVAKLLTIMDADSADAILAQMQSDQIRDILEKRLKVVRQPATQKGK